ncbi:hypothetical protein BGZ46_005009, partial [Entomortierella lignicola]
YHAIEFEDTEDVLLLHPRAHPRPTPKKPKSPPPIPKKPKSLRWLRSARNSLLPSAPIEPLQQSQDEEPPELPGSTVSLQQPQDEPSLSQDESPLSQDEFSLSQDEPPLSQDDSQPPCPLPRIVEDIEGPIAIHPSNDQNAQFEPTPPPSRLTWIQIPKPRPTVLELLSLSPFSYRTSVLVLSNANSPTQSAHRESYPRLGDSYQSHNDDAPNRRSSVLFETLSALLNFCDSHSIIASREVLDLMDQVIGMVSRWNPDLSTADIELI